MKANKSQRGTDITTLINKNILFQLEGEYKIAQNLIKKEEINQKIKIIKGEISIKENFILENEQKQGINAFHNHMAKLEEQSYKKKWTSLANFQKERKLEEYFDSSDQVINDREKLKKEAIRLFRGGYLRSTKDVIYKIDTQKIINIMGLKKIENKIVAFESLKKVKK